MVFLLLYNIFFCSTTEFKEAIGVLTNGVTLYPIIDSCCGAGFSIAIPKQYRGVPSYRGNRCRIIIITASDTLEGTTYDDCWLKKNEMDELSCTYFTYCLIWVIKKTAGNVTNYRLVEMIDEKLENMEKVRKRRGGIGSKEQHPGLFSSIAQTRVYDVPSRVSEVVNL
jgi:hypothetical protein